MLGTSAYRQIGARPAFDIDHVAQSMTADLDALARELNAAIPPQMIARSKDGFQGAWLGTTKFRGSHIGLEFGADAGKPTARFQINGDTATIREVLAEAPTPAALEAFIDQSTVAARLWAKQAAKHLPTTERDAPGLTSVVVKNVQGASAHGVAPGEPAAVSASLLGLAGATRNSHELWFGVARVGQLLGIPVASAVDLAVSDAKRAPVSRRQRDLLSAEQKRELKSASRALAKEDWEGLRRGLSRLGTMRETLSTPITNAELELRRASEAHRLGGLCDEIERIVQEKDVNQAYLAARAMDDIPEGIRRAHDEGFQLPQNVLARAAKITELFPEAERLNQLRIEAEHPGSLARDAEMALLQKKELRGLEPQAAAAELAKIDDAELSPRAKSAILEFAYQRTLSTQLAALQALLRTANPFQSQEAERLLKGIEQNVQGAKENNVDLAHDPRQIFVNRLAKLSDLGSLRDAVSALQNEYQSMVFGRR